MSSTASSRTFGSALALALLLLSRAAPLPRHGKLLHRDDFHEASRNWHIEAEKPGHISAANGVLDIDVPAGVTLWFKPRLEGPVAIEFEATAVAEGGPNDQVSDLNVFWMASNVDGRQPVFARARSGQFDEYNDLADLLRGPRRQSQHDDAFSPLHRRPGASAAAPRATISRGEPHMLVPNKPQVIRLVANGGTSNTGATERGSSTSKMPRLMKTAGSRYARRSATCASARLRIYRLH